MSNENDGNNRNNSVKSNLNSEIDVSTDEGLSQIDNIFNSSIGKLSPLLMVVVVIVLIVYFSLFSYLGKSASNEMGIEGEVVNGGSSSLEIILWGLFVFLLLINGIQYIFGIDVKTSINSLFKPKTDVDINVDSDLIDFEDVKMPSSGLGSGKQVFHVKNNKYTYDEAKALCKAFDSDLADYKQIEEAYNGGAEWCSYGWSKDGMALYPTQLSTWKTMQQIKGFSNSCGRPGINGGYIQNKDRRFGVNCYGVKPEATAQDIEIMESTSPFPTTEKERKLNNLVNQYKSKLNEILLSPFNYDKWSQI